MGSHIRRPRIITFLLSGFLDWFNPRVSRPSQVEVKVKAEGAKGGRWEGGGKMVLRCCSAAVLQSIPKRGQVCF
jgi:hypothetical protein